MVIIDGSLLLGVAAILSSIGGLLRALRWRPGSYCPLCKAGCARHLQPIADYRVGCREGDCSAP